MCIRDRAGLHQHDRDVHGASGNGRADEKHSRRRGGREKYRRHAHRVPEGYSQGRRQDDNALECMRIQEVVCVKFLLLYLCTMLKII